MPQPVPTTRHRPHGIWAVDAHALVDIDHFQKARVKVQYWQQFDVAPQLYGEVAIVTED